MFYILKILGHSLSFPQKNVAQCCCVGKPRPSCSTSNLRVAEKKAWDGRSDKKGLKNSTERFEYKPNGKIRINPTDAIIVY
jgi:hypothetical protein